MYGLKGFLHTKDASTGALYLDPVLSQTVVSRQCNNFEMLFINS